MKQFILTLVAVAIGGFLALLGYDRFVVAPREAAAAKAVPAARTPTQMQARPDPAHVHSEAAPDVEATAQRSADVADRGMDATTAQMDQRALVADAVQRVTMFRVALTEHYQTNGRWPRDADEAGLPLPDEMRGGAVRTVTIGAQGAITIALDDRFGAGSVVVLKPDVNAASGVVDWNCEVKGDRALKQAMPRCKG